MIGVDQEILNLEPLILASRASISHRCCFGNASLQQAGISTRASRCLRAFFAIKRLCGWTSGQAAVGLRRVSFAALAPPLVLTPGGCIKSTDNSGRDGIVVLLRALQLIPIVTWKATKRVAAPCGHLFLARDARIRYEAPQRPRSRRFRRARPGHTEPEALCEAATPAAAEEEVRGRALLLPQHDVLGHAVHQEPARPPGRPPHLCGSEARDRPYVQPDLAEAR